jgi:hypothetical protein
MDFNLMLAALPAAHLTLAKVCRLTGGFATTVAKSTFRRLPDRARRHSMTSASWEIQARFIGLER